MCRFALEEPAALPSMTALATRDLRLWPSRLPVPTVDAMTVSSRDAFTVADLMTGDLLALRPVDTVARARQVLSSTGLHALPVIDGERTVGVVTLADCNDRSEEEVVADVISRPPVTIDVGAGAAEAAALMRSELVHHLLVTDGGSEETIGILSTFDLLALLTD